MAPSDQRNFVRNSESSSQGPVSTVAEVRCGARVDVSILNAVVPQLQNGDASRLGAILAFVVISQSVSVSLGTSIPQHHEFDIQTITFEVIRSQRMAQPFILPFPVSMAEDLLFVVPNSPQRQLHIQVTQVSSNVHAAWDATEPCDQPAPRSGGD